MTVKMDNLDKESAKLLKVDELKSALKARRCSTSGKKAELYDRLAAYLDAESAEDHVSLVAETSSNSILANDSKLEESKTSSNSEENLDSVLAHIQPVVIDYCSLLHESPRFVKPKTRKSECRDCGTLIREHECPFALGQQPKAVRAAMQAPRRKILLKSVRGRKRSSSRSARRPTPGAACIAS